MNLGEEHEIFSRSLRGPRKLLGSDRGATKFFYKNLKFPPAPTRRYWSLNSIYIFSKPLPDKISEIPLHFSSASIGCDTKHSLSLHYFSKKGSDTIVSTPPKHTIMTSLGISKASFGCGLEVLSLSIVGGPLIAEYHQSFLNFFFKP